MKRRACDGKTVAPRATSRCGVVVDSAIAAGTTWLWWFRTLRAEGMAIGIMGRVWALRASDINATERLVLLNLADRATEDGERIYPAVATIAAETSLTRRGVQKALRRLEGIGLIRFVGVRARGAQVWSIVTSMLPAQCERYSRSTDFLDVDLLGDRHPIRPVENLVQNLLKTPAVNLMTANTVRGGGEYGSPDPSIDLKTKIKIRAKRAHLSLDQVRDPLIAALHHLYDEGLTDVGELTDRAKTIAARALGASWRHSREIAAIVDGVIAVRDAREKQGAA